MTEGKTAVRKLKFVVDKVVIPACRKVKPLGTLATYISQNLDTGDPKVKRQRASYFMDSYDHLKSTFIDNGKKSRFNGAVRRNIVERFEIIDNDVEITTTPTDSLFLAEALLSLYVDGLVVECGCYAGGSTAKISIITKILNPSSPNGTALSRKYIGLAKIFVTTYFPT